jgi:hypothetical protein
MVPMPLLWLDRKPGVVRPAACHLVIAPVGRVDELVAVFSHGKVHLATRQVFLHVTGYRGWVHPQRYVPNLLQSRRSRREGVGVTGRDEHVELVEIQSPAFESDADVKAQQIDPDQAHLLKPALHVHGLISVQLFAELLDGTTLSSSSRSSPPTSHSGLVGSNVSNAPSWPGVRKTEDSRSRRRLGVLDLAGAKGTLDLPPPSPATPHSSEWCEYAVLPVMGPLLPSHFLR